MRALNIAATGMSAQQTNVEVLANNISNMNTTGFKRARAEFQDLMYQADQRVGSPTANAETVAPAGVEIGSGVRLAAISRVNSQGEMIKTNNVLDVGISGKGWFIVNVPGEELPLYTRNGSFSLSGTGEIVTSQGYPVSPGIIVPNNATDITISKTGEVYVTIPEQVQPQLVGQLDFATFANDNGLKPLGENLFGQTQASGEPAPTVPGDAAVGAGTLMHRYVEASNVDSVAEITALISAQRAYEMNSKVIETADQMSNVTNQLR